MSDDSNSSINTTIDSSSSEDELLGIVATPHFRRMMFGGSSAPRPQITYNRLDWDRHVATRQHNGTFKQYYRMSLASFNRLVAMLNIDVDIQQSMRSTAGNAPIRKEMVVGAGIRYIAGSQISDLEDVYGVSPTSTKRMVDKFLDAAYECEALHIVSTEDQDQLTRIKDGFVGISTADNCFNGAVGALDGWFVTTNKPKDHEVDNVGDYFSGHYMAYGLNILAMCDSRLRFIYQAVAGPGRSNDNRSMLRLPRLLEWLLNLPVGFFIVADNAFTLNNRVLVPFRSMNVDYLLAGNTLDLGGKMLVLSSFIDLVLCFICILINECNIFQCRN